MIQILTTLMWLPLMAGVAMGMIFPRDFFRTRWFILLWGLVSFIAICVLYFIKE